VTSCLSGIRVVELTTMITGPLAGMMLADLGADVVKVEAPGGGDPFRSFRGGDHSPYFLAYNRNKRSIALNLRAPAGRQIFERLLHDADVLIENFRPGVLGRLGFPPERLRADYPRLILCSISGFGMDGPYADRPAYDAVAQAVSGVSSLFLGDEAQITGPTIADNLTGLFACYGILGALVERERTGWARHVDTNMLDSTIAFTPDTFLQHTLLGVEPGPLMRVQASQSYAVRCGDGRLLSIHLSSQDKFWRACAEAFDRPDWIDDPRFDDRAKRVDNYRLLAGELNAAAGRAPRSHWIARLTERDVPNGPVQSLPEVIADPQVRHLGTFADVSHPTRGPYKTVRRPVRFDGSRDDQPLGVPPAFNADGEAIVAGLVLDEATRSSWRREIQAPRQAEPV
jgi:crotonobetainyl-CoA:carnitine CoA-transferase CaiB-like acyl-CoA transferase